MTHTKVDSFKKVPTDHHPDPLEVRRFRKVPLLLVPFDFCLRYAPTPWYLVRRVLTRDTPPLGLGLVALLSDFGNASGIWEGN